MAAALGLTVGIVVAGLLGWQLTVAQDSPAQPAPVSSGRHPTGTPARSAAAVRTVNVSASLAGRPVAVVRRELRALGLLAEVRTQPDGQAAPGTVLRLHPTGQVRLGSMILITAATQPPSARRVTPAPAPGRPAGARPVPPGHAKHAKHGKGGKAAARARHQRTADQRGTADHLLVNPRGHHRFTWMTPAGSYHQLLRCAMMRAGAVYLRAARRGQIACRQRLARRRAACLQPGSASRAERAPSHFRAEARPQDF